MISDLHEGRAAAALLQSGLTLRLRAHGHSMKPLIPSGSLIRVAPAVHPPRVGDIIFYQRENGSVVAHRLLRQTAEHLWTKGDACATEDGRLERSQLLGRVVAVEAPLFFALDGVWARRLGLWLGFIYPKLVVMKVVLRRVLVREARQA